MEKKYKVIADYPNSNFLLGDTIELPDRFPNDYMGEMAGMPCTKRIHNGERFGYKFFEKYPAIFQEITDPPTPAPQDWREIRKIARDVFNNMDFDENSGDPQYSINDVLKAMCEMHKAVVTPLTSQIEEMRKEGWISVKDGLPTDEDSDVLVFWVKYPRPEMNYIGIAWYDGEKWKDDVRRGNAEDNPDFYHITHWMRMPAPPTQPK